MVQSARASRWVFLIALLAVPFALGAALAHALELPNKMALTRDDYFVVQQIYAGWNRLALVLLIEVAALAAIAVLHRNEKRVWRPAATALAFVLAAQAVFWSFTFPANEATANWTVVPENWNALRTNWEYSHLTGAVFQFLAMAALAIAVLNRRCPDPRSHHP